MLFCILQKEHEIANWLQTLISDKSATLFVKNLALTTTEEMLSELFPGANAIRLPRHEDSGNVKG